MVARIIPAFFSGGLFFAGGGSQPEKLCHKVLKIFVFSVGSAGGTMSSDSEEEEGEQWVCSYTFLPHNSALLSSAEVASSRHAHPRSE